MRAVTRFFFSFLSTWYICIYDHDHTIYARSNAYNMCIIRIYMYTCFTCKESQTTTMIDDRSRSPGIGIGGGLRRRNSFDKTDVLILRREDGRQCIL